MRKALLILTVMLYFLSALSSDAIRVKKVELHLAVVTGEKAALYSSDYGSSGKEYHTTGETFIVEPYESTRGDNWYTVDTDFFYRSSKYLSTGTSLEVRNLEGVVTARSNIRELPAASADVVTTISSGDVVTVLSRTQEKEKLEGFSNRDYWFEIKTIGGTTGWLYGAMVGLLQPREAVLFAIDALEEGDPDAAILAIKGTQSRFPNGRFYHYVRSMEDEYFDLAPTAELLLGYGYYLKGSSDTARTHYETAFAYGEKPALTTLKILQTGNDHTYYMTCDYYADTLARVGLGLSWVRADPDKAAGYFARAISDAESGFSTANIVPEYFDALLIRNLVAMHSSGKVNSGCLDALGTKLPKECSYDFAPGYFQLYYGESLHRSGNSSESVKMFKKVVEKYSDGYLYEQSGYYSGYTYMDIPARALWNLMNIQTRLNQTDSFVSYCGKIAKSNVDKRVGFFACYLAGIALDKIGESAMASKEYSRAERYFEVSGLKDSEYDWYYDDLLRCLRDRINGNPNDYSEEFYFKGYMSEA